MPVTILGNGTYADMASGAMSFGIVLYLHECRIIAQAFATTWRNYSLVTISNNVADGATVGMRYG